MCHCRSLQQQGPGTPQSREQRCHSAFFAPFIFAMPSGAAVCLYHTVIFLRCGSHNITVALLQGLRFVTATNGASVCACVRIMWQCHSVHNERQFQPTLPLNFKSIRAVQRQRYNSGTTPVNLAKLIYTGTPVFPHVKLRHPRDFKSTTSRRGTL